MPKERNLIIGYAVGAFLLAWLLVYRAEVDNLLALLIIPIIYSAIHYTRSVYLTMLGIGTVLSIWVIFPDGEWFVNSLQTVLVVAFSTLVVCEMIQHSVQQWKRTEDDYQKQGENFQALIENSQDLVSIINQDGTIRYVNSIVVPLLGYTPEEIKDKNVFELIHPDDRLKLLLAFKRSQARKTTFNIAEVRIGHRKGIWKWQTLHGTNHLSNINIRGVVIYTHDLSYHKSIEHEKKNLVSQLQESQKLESIGRLTAGIAHDFNNILTAIIGYSQALLRESNKENVKLRKKVLEIMKAGERGASLTRQLLAFCRKQVVATTTVQVNNAIQQMRSLLERLIGSDIELIFILNPKVGSIKADPVQIEQVLLNLAINARDAMPSGGKLIIETNNVVFEDHANGNGSKKPPELRTGNYIKISVIDTGLGMSNKIKAHIFEPFYTTKGNNKGTGLGLATTYSIIQQYGGFISVSSEPNRGSVFEIYLPCVQDTKKKTKIPMDDFPVPKGKETVLLVEDNNVVRHLVRDLLEEHGYKVLEAYHGAEALRLHDDYSQTIHLLIADVVIPKKNGFEVAKQITQKRPDMRVLYLSGHTDNATIQNYLERENAHFLEKPFSPETLLRKVREVLDSPAPHLLKVPQISNEA